MRIITGSLLALQRFWLKTPFGFCVINSEPGTSRKCEKSVISRCPGAKILDTPDFLSENELTFCSHSIAAHETPHGGRRFALRTHRHPGEVLLLLPQCGMPAPVTRPKTMNQNGDP